jgi:hypothetical protein
VNGIQTRERRPGGDQAAAVLEANKKSVPLAHDKVAVLDGVVLTPSELALYQSGVEAGIEIGRRQVEDENRESHETAARVARMVAETVPFEELCRRRGEERRAEHQRRILQARGVVA